MEANNKPKNPAGSQLIEFLGLIVFFIVYKISPDDQATRYASIALALMMGVQYLWYRRHKVKMPVHVWAVNLVAFIFLIPSIIFNNFVYFRYKLVAVKALFFLIPFVMLLFKKNFIKVLFQSAPAFEIFDDRDFDKVNYWFTGINAVGLAISLYGFFYLNDDDFLLLKAVWLPILGFLWVVPIAVIMYGKIKQQEAEKSSQANSQSHLTHHDNHDAGNKTN